MSPPLLGPEEDRLVRVSVAASSTSMDCLSQNDARLKERDYLGLSDCSSVDSSTVPSLLEENNKNLNLKATELRLGLPESHSHAQESEFCLMSSGKLDERPLFPLLPSKDGICSSQKNVISGNKRGFSDTTKGFAVVKSSVYPEGNWIFHTAGSESDSPQSVGQGKFPGNSVTNVMSSRPSATNQIKHNNSGPSNNHNNIPASKAQVVGWPPIRSFRKNSLTTASKLNEEVDGKPSSGALLVKVSMDGAPYLRKVDLRSYSTYQELSSALEQMFSCFTLGQCGSHGAGTERMSESKMRDLLHGSEYVLTYEDKDGDWMLVGDVPWEMFIASCKRLKIMKGSDAIGLAPRTTEKSNSRI